MGKIVITEKNNRLLLTLFDEKKPYLMETASLPETESMLGNIYLARVKDVVPGINGAFLAVSGDKTAFLPLGRCRELLCANRELAENSSLHQGDEIVVQITGEALKTKPPTASGKLTLTGQYCVCNYFGHGISYSQKLDEEKKKSIAEGIQKEGIEGRKQYHFTIRTNTESLESYEPLFNEMDAFIHTFQSLTNVYQHRTLYSCLYHREPEIIGLIKNIPLNAYDEIVTDKAEVYQLLTDELLGIQDKKIRLYQDAMLSLSKLYSLETHLQEALGRKVWLRCGGYLVIEPTEAMVVIDVNTGRASGKASSKANGKANSRVSDMDDDKAGGRASGKASGSDNGSAIGRKADDSVGKSVNHPKKTGNLNDDDYLKVNLEAAQEVARQLRIRNYSGMIMVDFINMKSEENNRKLLAYLDTCLQEDKIKTRLVDMTALGIVEITRKKIRRPLGDFMK